MNRRAALILGMALALGVLGAVGADLYHDMHKAHHIYDLPDSSPSAKESK